MPLRDYLRGKQAARKDFGDDEEPAYSEQSHTGRNLAMGAGMAAPWAGLIGTKRQRDPGHPSTHTRKDFEKAMRSGDILLSGDINSGSTKSLVSLTSNTPEAYHAALVGNGGRHLIETGPDGVYRIPFSGQEGVDERHFRLLRPRMSPEEIAQQVAGAEQFADSMKQYSSAVARRGVKMKTPLDSAAFKWFANADSYGEAGPKTLLREMYVPKLRSEKAMRSDAAATQAARAGLAADPQAAAKKTTDALRDSKYYESNTAKLKHKIQTNNAYKHLPVLLQEEPHQPPSSVFRAGLPDCARGVCSSLPAQHLPAGKFVVPGKLPQHVLPGDYMRSDLYDTVASHSPRPVPSGQEKLLRHGLPIARLGAGLGTAAMVYGADRARDALVRKFKARKQRDPSQTNEP